MATIINNDPSNPIAVVDTDVFSFWFKGDSRGDPYRQYARGYYLSLSFATIGELYYWAYQKRWGSRLIEELKQTISKYLVLPSDDEICENFAKSRIQQETKGKSIGYIDYWIAACALKYNYPILTNNYNHFSRIKGIKLLGPYSN